MTQFYSCIMAFSKTSLLSSHVGHYAESGVPQVGESLGVLMQAECKSEERERSCSCPRLIQQCSEKVSYPGSTKLLGKHQTQ